MTIPNEIRVLKCADCARSESAVEGVRPDGVLPIPVDALTGWQEGRPGEGGVSRRSLLANGALGLASVYGASKLSFDEIFQTAIAEGAQPDSCLVVIYLNGGNDGLNCLVPNEGDMTSSPVALPHGYAAYKAARPNIYRVQGNGTMARAGSTPLPGGVDNAKLAFANPLVSGTDSTDKNQSPYGLDTLFGDGTGTGIGSDLAVVPGAEYSPSNGSHFESRDYWFAGATTKMQTGWLGRWLDNYGSTTNPLQAVSIDSDLSKQIRSSKAPVAALQSLTGVGFNAPGLNTDSVNAEVAKLAAVQATAGNDHLARSRGMYGLTVDVANKLKAVPPGAAKPGYPNSYLSDRLKLAATLLGAGLGTRFVTIDWGGFDTHGDQLASQDPQLRTLSQALGAFKEDLKSRGIEQKVVTMVFSEFGRRVHDNESLGTDHGAGGTILLSGSVVRGGLAGENPGLYDTDGNLSVSTDFRSVYQALITDWLGGDPAAVLPGGGTFKALNPRAGKVSLLKAA